MRQSVLFSRVFLVVILAITITALFTTIFYNYISRAVFTTIKENEMLPKARALGSIVQNFREGELDKGALKQLLAVENVDSSLLGAYILVTDEQGGTLLINESLPGEYLSAMREGALSVLESGELDADQIPALRHTGLVGVGIPMKRGDAVTGAVMMLVPLYEAMVGASSLNGALMISLLLSLPVVTVLVYYIIGRIVNPLRQMRDVAVGMAGGDFSARADDTQRGEVGQLARSLNYLSQELSKSISALVVERNRLRQTIDGLSEGIVSVDSIGRVTHHNPALDALFAALPAGHSGGDDDRLELIPDKAVWADFDAVTRGGQAVARRIVLPDRVLSMTIMPLMDMGCVVAGAVGLFSDITESERLERTRRDYVANVSHELRTPLTAMRALIEPLAEGMVRDEQTKNRYYSIMLRETLRLSRLINDLMELSRLQSGQLSLATQPMRLADILDDLVEKYTATASEGGIAFHSAVGDCPPVMANPDRVEQVLVILLDNAIKYTAEGGRVTIEAEVRPEGVTLCVADTGVGILPEDQPYVFDRFYKVDRARSALGSGLGLSIASELIRSMGERIWVSSEPGRGSKFFFTLKRAAPRK
jgi:signal transduction histidine kinase